MTEQERKYFDLLAERRKQRAETINDAEFRSGFENNIDKYSDQAHFIYELLQNADDAGATQVRFLLEKDYLVFAHNGTKRFFVSNPETVEKDKAAGRYGSVNSITAIGYSNKHGENAIGKFGVGFMSVFQYTNTPKIYDANICFQIEQLIVPVLIPECTGLRKSGETTLFLLPFDSDKCSKTVAFSDIAKKLRSLSYPLMFLNSLGRIDYQIGERSGTYLREEIDGDSFGDIFANRRRFTFDKTHDGANSPVIEEYWFFSRGESGKDRYAVCFALEKDDLGNDKLKRFDSPIFCFFQTKPLSGLHFAIHAPFLLTDNRENVKAGNEHNKEMINRLAALAADSLICLRDIGIKQGTRLIDDGILNIIPTNENDFSEENDTDKLSLRPIFTAIRKKMCSEELLPTTDGYTSSENAYWADTEEIAKLFSEKQLSALSGNSNAHWVFVTIGRNRGKFTQYIDEITDEKWCDENAIISGRKRYWYSNDPKNIVLSRMDERFIEGQTIEWLHRFYKWLSGTESRTNRIKTVPIFLNQYSRAKAAYSDSNELILFLPSDGIEGVNTVAPELLNNSDTVHFLTNKVGIKQPSRKDYIYNVILPQYRDGAAINTRPHFKLFFDYYFECSRNEVEGFVKRLKPCKFLSYYYGEIAYRESADNLYFPDANLRAFFADKPDTKFVAWNSYLSLVGDERKEDLRQFLSDLGVHSGVRIIERKERFNWQEAHAQNLNYPNSTRPITWIFPEIDGVAELLSAIQEGENAEKSLLLWRELLEIIKQKCNWRTTLEKLLTGKCEYYYRRQKTYPFLALIGAKLRESAWLMDCNGRFAAPSDLTIGTLREDYDLSDDAAEELIRFLGIKESLSEVEAENDNLTDEQREQIAFAKEIEKQGFTKEQVKEILEREKLKKSTSAKQLPNSENTSEPATAYFSDEEDNDNSRSFRQLFEKQSPAKKDVLKRILQGPPEESEDLDDEDEWDADEYTPPAVNYQRRIRRAEEKSRREVDRIAREKELSDQLKETPKYSYAWFRALMELEALGRSENESGSREISISFGKVELEPGTERTLVLKQPSRYIPGWMEDFVAGIPLTLQAIGREHRVMIEVSSVKGYTLLARLRNAEEIKGIDLSIATARISVQNPGFLMESLQQGFAELGFADDYDMKANLSENIKFVFGPPGTGKTTYLAREELIPLMQGAKDERVLVLTPTNKAADVLTMRIMELMGEDTTYSDWLVRFGTTYDEQVEHSDVFKDRSFYLPKLRRCVVVTTIARFPYDSIGGQSLCAFPWDRVIIDEASMIPIANIVYPIFQCKPKQFIIAGDPLQIQPVAQVEPDENIYKMVGLKSFTDPHTEPHDYEVKLLTTQYRSIPSVGEVFSRFAYGGVLKHARKEDSRKRTSIDDILEIAPLNIIKFPVSKYEGIYLAKKLGNSPYHIYSALLAHEFAVFLANKIGATNPDERYSIGVISPYRAQAALIDRLLTRTKLPLNVSVQAGTVHGFQGDECNMIIAVLNPPKTITGNKEVYLNKPNIINVSISRARDCLFVLMPDRETENIDKLMLIENVEDIMKSGNAYREFSADEIEELLFGRPGFLEENTFSTSHQNVNVYGLPEKRYEVRSEETAIDVQIYEAE